MANPHRAQPSSQSNRTAAKQPKIKTQPANSSLQPADSLLLQRAIDSPALLTPFQVQQLQRMVGNRAVQQLLVPSPRLIPSTTVQRGFFKDLKQTAKSIGLYKSNFKQIETLFKKYNDPKYADQKPHFVKEIKKSAEAWQKKKGSSTNKEDQQKAGRIKEILQQLEYEPEAADYKKRTELTALPHGLNKSQIYKGHAGSVGSQQKVLEITSLSPAGRAAQLYKVLTGHYLSNATRFNQARFLLHGGNIEAEFKRVAQNKSGLRDMIQQTFADYPFRVQYLLELLDRGGKDVSPFMQFAEKIGLLLYTNQYDPEIDPEPFFKPGNRNNVIEYMRTMPPAELKKVYTSKDAALQDYLGRTLGERGQELLKAMVERQAGEEKRAKLKQASDSEEKQAKLGQSDEELLDLYDAETAAMVRLRRSKLTVGIGLGKDKRNIFKNIFRTKGTFLTKTEVIVNELRQWALDKDPRLVRRLTERKGKLFKQLSHAFSVVGTWLSGDGVKYVYEVMQNPDSSNPAQAAEQIRAILERRSKSKFSKGFKTGKAETKKISDILDQVDPEKMQKQFGLEGVKKLEKLAGAAALDPWFTLPSLLGTPNKRAIANRLRYGIAAKAGSSYDKLWNIANSKLKTYGDLLRVSRNFRNIIAREVEPGSSEYELLRRDGDLLRKIKKFTRKNDWKDIAQILNLSDEAVTKQEVLPESIAGAELETAAKKKLQVPTEAQAQQQFVQNRQKYWATRINMEMRNLIPDSRQVLQYVFDAQIEAREIAGQSKITDKTFMQGIYGLVDNKFVPNDEGTFQLSFFESERRQPTIDRIRKALKGEKALTVGDLLDAAKGSFGKIRTSTATIEKAIDALSGKELLQAWSTFDSLYQEYQKIKADPKQRAKFKYKLALTIKPEFFDQKLDKLGFGSFGEVEGQHVTFRDLLKRAKRVDLERKLLNRIADQAETVPEFQEMAAWAAGVESIPAARLVAAQYFANRTRGIGNLETAQLLGSGAQWSLFSTRSSEYKGTQGRLMGVLREDIGLDDSKKSAGEKFAALSGNVAAFGAIGKRLGAEEEAFRKTQATYNARVKSILTGVASIITAAIAAGISAATMGAGTPFALAMLGGVLIATAGSLATGLLAAGIEFATKGGAYSHIDKMREVILDTLRDAATAAATAGAKAFTAGTENLGIKVVGALLQELGSQIASHTRKGLDRILNTTDLNELAATIESNLVKDVGTSGLSLAFATGKTTATTAITGSSKSSPPPSTTTEKVKAGLKAGVTTGGPKLGLTGAKQAFQITKEMENAPTSSLPVTPTQKPERTKDVLIDKVMGLAGAKIKGLAKDEGHQQAVLQKIKETLGQLDLAILQARFTGFDFKDNVDDLLTIMVKQVKELPPQYVPMVDKTGEQQDDYVEFNVMNTGEFYWAKTDELEEYLTGHLFGRETQKLVVLTVSPEELLESVSGKG